MRLRAGSSPAGPGRGLAVPSALSTVPPLTLLSSRASGVLAAQLTATTAAKYAAGSAPVVSAIGDADWLGGATLPGGYFGGPSIPDDFPDPYVLTGWTLFNATLGVPVDRTAPDGTLTAVKVIDASASGTAVYISASAVARSQCIWYRYESAPAVAGSFLIDGSTSVPLPPPSPFSTAWQKFFLPGIASSVPGVSATPWNTSAASTGEIVVWATMVSCSPSAFTN